MKSLKKTLSLALGGIAVSALLASAMVAPAFAEGESSSSIPVRETASAYTEVVAYDSSVTTASTEVLINTEFHYLDYSPEIDVTYSWEEEMEWIYLRSGKYGLWVKGKDAASALAFVNIMLGSSYGPISDFGKMTEEDWEYLVNNIGNPESSHRITSVITFENNASNELYLSLEAQKINLDSVTVDGKTIPSESITSQYLKFKDMLPDPYDDRFSVHEKTSVCISSSLKIGTTSTTEEGDKLPDNKVMVGVLPDPELNPSNYALWTAENRKLASVSGRAIQAQLKLIFTKV